MSAHRIEYDRKSLIIDGKREFLFGGEIHYFRVPRELWRDRLEKIRRIGCNFIATYVPWNYHEPEPGRMEWSGDRDLGAFLELCREYGLWVVIKPGPYICAEWDFGGFPDWLLGQNHKLRLPDEKYYGLIRHWYGAVGKVIKPHLATNGGNIILVQIENEYDHLIEMSEEFRISKKEAQEYLLKLLAIARESGLDIPAFTNEGRCILGTEIINTYTYYPNIPLIWMWEFNDFDRKLEESGRLQPDKPLMILELETGWFAQFGQPLYEAPFELTEAITKTVVNYGSSLLNYYMLAGGTTFPYWHCKGDFGGIGTCTTFDFGGVPIREWGEINRKYHFLRAMKTFVDDFGDVLREGECDYGLCEVAAGWKHVARLAPGGASRRPDAAGTFENVKILERLGARGGFVLMRNLEDEPKTLAVKCTTRGGRRESLPELTLAPHSSLLLPVGVDLEGTGLTLARSTSELVANREIGGRRILFLRGKAGVPGETVLEGDPRSLSALKILEGRAKKSGVKGGIRYSYDHASPLVLGDARTMIRIAPEAECEKLWLESGLAVLSDMEYLKSFESTRTGRKLLFRARPGRNQSTSFLSDLPVKRVTVDGRTVKPRLDRATGFLTFSTSVPDEEAVRAEWTGPWKYTPDSREKEADLDDRDWREIPAHASLEGNGLLKHGYYWYRSSFDLPVVYGEVFLKMTTNAMDRFTVYVNGVFRWIGIGNPELEITSLLKNGRNVVTILYDNAFHTKAHPHEGPVQKLSGLFHPVKVRILHDGREESFQIRAWRVRQGLGGDAAGYGAVTCDEGAWLTAPPAEKYVIQEEMGNIVWFRRRFRYNRKKGWTAPLYLEIPELRDRCLIYLNGTLVGKYEHVGPQTRFYLPENMLQARNQLALAVEGPGFHPVKQFGFIPAYFKELKLGTYYAARDVEVRIE